MTLFQINNEDLNMALMYLAGALPCRFEWVALISADGDVVAHYRGDHEAPAAGGMVAALGMEGSHLADVANNGAFRCNINVGDTGLTVTIPLSHEMVLCINMKQVKSLDAVMRGVQEGLPPLLELLEGE